MTVNNDIPVHENQEFAKGFFYMIAVANGKENLSQLEKWMWLEAFQKHDVKPIEVYNAFWEAFGDQYVGKDGIEFKHIWKHIKEHRAKCYIPPEPYQTKEEYLEEKLKQLKKG